MAELWFCHIHSPKHANMVSVSDSQIEWWDTLNQRWKNCASAASMLAEEIWQIAEGFVEVSANLLAQLKKCGIYFPRN